MTKWPAPKTTGRVAETLRGVALVVETPTGAAVLFDVKPSGALGFCLYSEGREWVRHTLTMRL
jgi:hypothetical protein